MPIVRCNREMHVSAEPETGRERGLLSSFSIVRYNTRIRARLRGRIFFWYASRVAESCAGTDRPRIFDDYRSYASGNGSIGVPVRVNEVTIDRAWTIRERPSFIYRINISETNRFMPIDSFLLAGFESDSLTKIVNLTNLLDGFIWTRYKKLRNVYLCISNKRDETFEILSKQLIFIRIIYQKNRLVSFM